MQLLSIFKLSTANEIGDTQISAEIPTNRECPLHSGRPHTAIIVDMQDEVREIIEQHPQTSTQHLATNTPKSSSGRQCLQKVGMKSYHMSCLQELKTADCTCQLHFIMN